MSKIKLNKVEVKVSKVETVKVDNRKNNTGRPVNKKSARQIRLNKQAFYADVNAKFKKGNQFEINNSVYKYSAGKSDSKLGGAIVNEIGGYVCNVDYIGRTKVKGYTFVLGKKVNVELNLKTLQFVK